MLSKNGDARPPCVDRMCDWLLPKNIKKIVRVFLPSPTGDGPKVGRGRPLIAENKWLADRW